MQTQTYRKGHAHRPMESTKLYAAARRDDARRRQEIELRNQLDSLVYSTERTLAEQGAKLGDGAGAEAPERRLHVAGSEVDRRQPIGIDPDAHGDLPAALDGHALHGSIRSDSYLSRQAKTEVVRKLTRTVLSPTQPLAMHSLQRVDSLEI